MIKCSMLDLGMNYLQYLHNTFNALWPYTEDWYDIQILQRLLLESMYS